MLLLPRAQFIQQMFIDYLLCAGQTHINREHTLYTKTLGHGVTELSAVGLQKKE